MRRREFITGLGAATLASPSLARAQQTGRLRPIAIIGGDDEQINALKEALAQAGWREGHNISIQRLNPTGLSDDGLRRSAADIVARRPDVIVSQSTLTTAILKQLTSAIPIVFVNVSDPVANGIVASFAHPGGNITGFTTVEFSVAGKWLSLLKYIVPGLSNVMMLYNPDNPNSEGFWRTLEASAPRIGVVTRAAPASDIGEIERQIESFARQKGAGMIVVPSVLNITGWEMIAALAARYRLPAIYAYRFFATGGSLAPYGPDVNDIYRRAAQYVDRILRGAEPADLPVQAPTKFDFVVNLKAAQAIGLEISTSVQLLADEVIE